MVLGRWRSSFSLIHGKVALSLVFSILVHSSHAEAAGLLGGAVVQKASQAAADAAAKKAAEVAAEMAAKEATKRAAQEATKEAVAVHGLPGVPAQLPGGIPIPPNARLPGVGALPYNPLQVPPGFQLPGSGPLRNEALKVILPGARPAVPGTSGSGLYPSTAGGFKPIIRPGEAPPGTLPPGTGVAAPPQMMGGGDSLGSEANSGMLRRFAEAWRLKQSQGSEVRFPQLEVEGAVRGQSLGSSPWFQGVGSNLQRNMSDVLKVTLDSLQRGCTETNQACEAILQRTCRLVRNLEKSAGEECASAMNTLRSELGFVQEELSKLSKDFEHALKENKSSEFFKNLGKELHRSVTNEEEASQLGMFAYGMATCGSSFYLSNFDRAHTVITGTHSEAVSEYSNEIALAHCMKNIVTSKVPRTQIGGVSKVGATAMTVWKFFRDEFLKVQPEQKEAIEKLEIPDLVNSESSQDPSQTSLKSKEALGENIVDPYQAKKGSGFLDQVMSDPERRKALFELFASIAGKGAEKAAHKRMAKKDAEITGSRTEAEEGAAVCAADTIAAAVEEGILYSLNKFYGSLKKDSPPPLPTSDPVPSASSSSIPNFTNPSSLLSRYPSSVLDEGSQNKKITEEKEISLLELFTSLHGKTKDQKKQILRFLEDVGLQKPSIDRLSARIKLSTTIDAFGNRIHKMVLHFSEDPTETREIVSSTEAKGREGQVGVHVIHHDDAYSLLLDLIHEAHKKRNKFQNIKLDLRE